MITYPLMNNKDTIQLESLNEPIYNLLKKTFTIPKSFRYNLIEVTKEYVARPDLLSLHIYDSSNYADVLCKLNGISNPFELNEGLIIVAPDINDIYLFYQLEDSNNTTISSSGKENKQESAKAIQKKKNEPRKANEQVVGDRNFRIDKNNKIVIY